MFGHNCAASVHHRNTNGADKGIFRILLFAWRTLTLPKRTTSSLRFTCSVLRLTHFCTATHETDSNLPLCPDSDDLLDQSPAASLGEKGGKATAKRGSDYYRKIAAMRKTHAGGRPPSKSKPN